MQISTKYGQLFILTKFGFLQIYELTTNQLIYSNKITESSIFIGQQDSKEDGVYSISRNGSVQLIQIDQNSFLNYLMNNCQQIPNVVQLAFKLAGRYRLPGVDGMFTEQFNKFLMSGDYAKAAQIAASAPGELLRNAQTISKFKTFQGTPSPLLIYFQSLLQKGGLNALESVELCNLVLSQGRKQFVEAWLKENKLECTEQLGDLVSQHDQNSALEIYKRANAGPKVLQTLVALGRQDEANKYAQQSGINVDYMSMIKSCVFTNPVNAVQMAKTMFAQNNGNNIHAVAELFVQAQKFKELSALLVDCMKQNKPEDGPWQTKILEWNIINEPNIVEPIFQLTKWNQYNRLRIAQLCEQKQLFQKALENYSDIKDIKRVCLNTQFIPHPYLVSFFGNLQPDWALTCIYSSQKCIKIQYFALYKNF
ncbi:clathrin heavy chain, putative [Ichthyophthirius multifiliis]|uniref:Clathrin heavy chain, putative n=1 Tax=Ichthyophthirius multifiliis TaxID=5932 RepID=G0QMD9_ICHMU|nr:clathrin heavy chain, putative [Ichthyophthirius multifiliis]EGR33608.1 clathrin heavy chain, putative [Ichthyophthirius multifiliis]|eukprot:XP_004037594.1 clathrin heavy chain, putative [Ichthyophthirius multifiliis]